jgi:two-component system CheB/CheR fusion protein
MANQAPVMIWMAGTNQRKNFFNETWHQYTGTETQNGNDGWKDQIYPEDLQQYLKVLSNGYEKQRPFIHEYRLKGKGGEYRWILEIGKPIYSENKFTGFIGSCTEVHDKVVHSEELELKVSERTKALKEMNIELERSNVELQQFAYVASHDLQEPLRKNLIYADRLLRLKEPLPASAIRFVNKIFEASERMRILIEELLEFSRLSNQESKFEQIDLRSLVQKLLSDFEIVIHEKKAVIQVGKLPVVHAVHVQMDQLFHNLISNALKFSKPKQSPKIVITATPLNRKLNRGLGLTTTTPYVKITVADNGIGIPPSYEEKIFEIFHRLNPKKDYPGTGIGLALCRKIVNNHGGKIVVESTEDKTEFHIILPTR